MLSRLPVRRFLQRTDKTEIPQARFGVLQWVLARPLFRFRIFDLSKVPTKNRPQALQLELSQWTPFAHTDYYIGWHRQQALVWGWEASRTKTVIEAHGLKLQRVRVIPESALHSPQQDGLHLIGCVEGYEGQLWEQGSLAHSRWWAHLPSQDEWLMLQRDAGIQPDRQQTQVPPAQAGQLNPQPWIVESVTSSSRAMQMEHLAIALGLLLLATTTFWFCFGLLKAQHSLAQLREQHAQLRQEAEPITQARIQSLDSLDRIKALSALVSYPSQLMLMAKLADALPNDKSYVSEWNFQQGKLKIAISSPSDISATFLIGAIQQAGPFRDVQALPGNDSKNVTFQMEVVTD